METRLVDLTYEEWVRHVFDHDVHKPEWHFDLDADYWDGPHTLTIIYMTRLFQESLSLVENYSDAQINQGLWYIAHNACSNCMFALTDASVPMPDKIACVQAMFPLYRDLFARRCTPDLGHRSEGDNPLNLACYMWWDLLPLTAAPHDGQRGAFDKAVLEVMRQILELDSPACQEGALHGLGHWARDYPGQVKTIIENYLQRSHNLRPELVDYARSAQAGCVL
jgi:hypothetical protein